MTNLLGIPIANHLGEHTMFKRFLTNRTMTKALMWTRMDLSLVNRSMYCIKIWANFLTKQQMKILHNKVSLPQSSSISRLFNLPIIPFQISSFMILPSPTSVTSVP